MEAVANFCPKNVVKRCLFKRWRHELIYKWVLFLGCKWLKVNIYGIVLCNWIQFHSFKKASQFLDKIIQKRPLCRLSKGHDCQQQQPRSISFTGKTPTLSYAEVNIAWTTWILHEEHLINEQKVAFIIFLLNHFNQTETLYKGGFISKYIFQFGSTL